MFRLLRNFKIYKIYMFFYKLPFLKAKKTETSITSGMSKDVGMELENHKERIVICMVTGLIVGDLNERYA